MLFFGLIHGHGGYPELLVTLGGGSLVGLYKLYGVRETWGRPSSGVTVGDSQ